MPCAKRRELGRLDSWLSCEIASPDQGVPPIPKVIIVIRNASISVLCLVIAATFTITAAEAPLPEGMRLQALPSQPPVPADNPTSPTKVALGRLLFFDPILSATREVACATCHHPQYAWADGRATPIGVDGTGLGPARKFTAANPIPPLKRNTPTLLNVAFNGLVSDLPHDPARAPMFWDSRVSSLESQSLVPLKSREEMRGDACLEGEATDKAIERVNRINEYRQLFSAAFGKPSESAVISKHLAQAIAAFERTLIAGDTPFDRFLRGDKSALGELQQRGLKVFQDAGCIQCHGGPMLSDFKPHFIGVSDGSVDGKREFRTPTLRNLKFTAPYMHNGSQRSLEEVMVFYEALSDAVSETLDGGDASTQPRLDPLLTHLNLVADDFPALEAFLDALNDDHYDRSVPDHVPSGLPVPR